MSGEHGARETALRQVDLMGVYVVRHVERRNSRFCTGTVRAVIAECLYLLIFSLSLFLYFLLSTLCLF